MSGDHGAAMVELAFVLTFLVMLLVGIVSSAIALGQNNSIENAAREGSRFGATLPDSGTWLDSVLDVTKAAAIGDLADTVSGQYICVALVSPSGTKSKTETGGVRSGELSAECFSDGRPSGERRVQVVTERETTIEAIIFSMDVTLSAPAAARFERAS